MTPAVPSVLSELAQLLMRNAVPDVPDAERASALGLSAMLLGLAAEVWDGAAYNLVDENRALRALLGEKGSDDDLHLSAYTTPPLTTIHQPALEIAERAMQLLLDLSNGRKVRRLRHVLEPALVVRGSTAPPSSQGLDKQRS